MISKYRWPLLAVLAGVLVGIVVFPWPVRGSGNSEAVAKSSGFSSAEKYDAGMELMKEVRREKRLSEPSLQRLREIVRTQGESGELLGLATVLPIEDRTQLEAALEAVQPALANRNHRPMSESVLKSFRNRDEAVVSRFLARNPQIQAVMR